MPDSHATAGQPQPGRTVPIAATHPLDENVLARHHAKVLRPDQAPPPYLPRDAKTAGPDLLPTIYRYDRLLVPAQLFRDAVGDDFRGFLHRTLGADPQAPLTFVEEPVSPVLTSPDAQSPDAQHPDAQHPDAQHPDAQHPETQKQAAHHHRPADRQPRRTAAANADGAGEPGIGHPIRLLPAPGSNRDEPIDAWRVLQTLRAAADAESAAAAGGAATSGTHAADGTPPPNAMRREQAAGVTLDHLLFGADGNISGAGASVEGHPGGGRGRMPVVLPMTTSPWVDDARFTGGHRPVVAVLDTGLELNPDTKQPLHPWLKDGAELFLDYLDGEDPEGGKSYVRPLLGELDSHSGHGTFIAGIIRQLAPAARILAIRIMHSDGIVYQSDLEDALDQLHQRVQDAVDTNNRDKFVDVVSMSFGWYDENGSSPQAARLLGKLQALRDLGVIVVASAGNDATADPPVYPAGFSQLLFFDSTPPNPVPAVLAAGAKMTPSTHAIYSNEAPWVNVWYPGSSIVSTLPTALLGGGQPDLSVMGPGTQPRRRQGYDPDNFEYGFGVWSGTSFAAAMCAGTVANALTGQLGTLGTLSAAAARDRACKVVRQIVHDEQDQEAP